MSVQQIRLKHKSQLKNVNLGVNPFLASLEIKVRKVTQEGQFKVNKDGLKLPVESDYEYTPYFKTFSTAAHRKIIGGLSDKALRLYTYLGYIIKHGEDYVWITKESYMEEWNVSINTFKKAVQELVRYGLITPTIVSKVYWINPDFFFKGSRVNKFPKNLKEVV